jgi:hypothetical protein
MTESEQLAQYREAESRNLVNTAIADALAGHSLTEGSADQIGQLVRNELRVVDDNGRKIVVGPAYQPVREVIAARLARPDHQKFLKNGGGGPSSPAAPVSSGPDGRPATLAEAIRMQMAETKRTPGDWRHDRSRPMPTEPEKR